MTFKLRAHFSWGASRLFDGGLGGAGWFAEAKIRAFGKTALTTGTWIARRVGLEADWRLRIARTVFCTLVLWCAIPAIDVKWSGPPEENRATQGRCTLGQAQKFDGAAVFDVHLLARGRVNARRDVRQSAGPVSVQLDDETE